MTIDAFADRLARVRQRFVATLAGKIDDAQAVVAKLAADTPAAAASVAEAYRAMHGIVGVGRTVGFPSTGSAAHQVEYALRAAHREGRGLSADEITQLKTTLDVLREAATRELQSLCSSS